MTKEQFCVCANTLRDYASWERKLYECGMDLTGLLSGAFPKPVVLIVMADSLIFEMPARCIIFWCS